jgi:hypothetical protein
VFCVLSLSSCAMTFSCPRVGVARLVWEVFGRSTICTSSIDPPKCTLQHENEEMKDRMQDSPSSRSDWKKMVAQAQGCPRHRSAKARTRRTTSIW